MLGFGERHSPGSVADMGADDPAAYLVNLTELARVTGISANTLRGMIQTEAGFPVVERGSNGRDYQFDSRAVASWLRDRDAAAAEADAARQADLARQQAELFGEPAQVDEAGRPMTARERREAGEAELVAMRVARVKATLIPAAEVAYVVEHAGVYLQRELLALPDAIARELSLSREERVRLDALLRRVADGLADNLKKAGRDGLADLAA